MSNPAWKYGKRASETNRNKVTCILCGLTFNSGISCHKHLLGNSTEVQQCKKCPNEVRQEIKDYVERKKDLKCQMLSPKQATDLDDDEMEEGEAAVSSSYVSTGTKGPIDTYYPLKPGNESGKSGKILQVVAKGILRDRAVMAFSRWMYDAGLPFNCVNYDTFADMIKAIGQYGPGMKPPTYHEVSVVYLNKEVEETQKIVEEHRVEWNKFGCSIMMDKWTARTGKMIINVLVNFPRASLFLDSIDASDTDSIEMFSLFKSTIEKIGPENVVQV
ncbi:uncharacterized protein LOC124893838, partial [Capsicum annuum]|uniref:uncharacterized protein LOC124893838 n=1 Tax=Capsicum annuum TaxID=4072 RepID=UPI001FB0696A